MSRFFSARAPRYSACFPVPEATVQDWWLDMITGGLGPFEHDPQPETPSDEDLNEQDLEFFQDFQQRVDRYLNPDLEQTVQRELDRRVQLREALDQLSGAGRQTVKQAHRVATTSGLRKRCWPRHTTQLHQLAVQVGIVRCDAMGLFRSQLTETSSRVQQEFHRRLQAGLALIRPELDHAIAAQTGSYRFWHHTVLPQLLLLSALGFYFHWPLTSALVMGAVLLKVVTSLSHQYYAVKRRELKKLQLHVLEPIQSILTPGGQHE